MILLPCSWCTGQRPDAPHLAEPAESRLRFRCPVCLESLEVALCPMHEIEAMASEEEGALCCPTCHGHPRHECVHLELDATDHL